MLLTLIGALFTPGCGPGGELSMRIEPHVRRDAPDAMLLICDGLSARVLDEELAAGRAPNIQRYLVERGTRARHAITGVPSITYSSITTMFTGASPHRHRIIANEWFDRESCLCRSYSRTDTYELVNHDMVPPTIYERLRGRDSVSIQLPLHRGASRHYASRLSMGIRWLLADYPSADRLAVDTLPRVVRRANQRGVWPDMLTLYFPGVDNVGHLLGIESEAYRRAVRNFDHQVGRICRWMEQEGLLDSTVIALVSDHGMVSVADDRIRDVKPFLRQELGRRVTDRRLQDGSALQRESYFAKYDTVFVDSARCFAKIHLRGDGDWAVAPDPAAVRAMLTSAASGRRLWQLEGVALTAFRTGPGEIAVHSAAGEARIRERAGPAGMEFCYEPVTADVLQYSADPELARFVARGFHPCRDWLNATAAHEFPDVVPQLGPLLHEPRSGDVLLFAEFGYSFGPERSGHGGVHAEEMRIPLLLAGPGVPRGGIIPVARSVDVLPTLLSLLGEPIPDDNVLDGEPLLGHPGQIARDTRPRP